MTMLNKVKEFFSKLLKKDKAVESKKIEDYTDINSVAENEEIAEVEEKNEICDCDIVEEVKEEKIDEEISAKEATTDVIEEKIEEKQPLKEQKIEEIIVEEQDKNSIDEEISHEEETLEEIEDVVSTESSTIVEEDAKDEKNLEFLKSLDNKRLIDVKNSWNGKIEDLELEIKNLESEGLIQSDDNEKLLSSFTVKDLKEICKTHNIKVKSSARKQEIIETIILESSEELLDEVLKNVKYYTLTKKAKEIL